MIQLRHALPTPFYLALDTLLTLLPLLPDPFAPSWPLVPNHTDLCENNIHVDVATGKIAGICDWRRAAISPFGMALGWVEIVLGTLTTNGDEGFWCFYPAHEEPRARFWTRFCTYRGGLEEKAKRRVETARLVGRFLTAGFQGGKPAAAGSEELGFLTAVLRHGASSLTPSKAP
ncbi:hypothetical protein LMH87_001688 [Akanthomyces muscarius]|uniref:Aminoglycoside phosphotransferase domain-containing protein n=1 Tax=Akanthomyces muscarius TaxID=2231603 RepID=A0A9W8UIX0_AKAMU|nr:hypothetical protein LMH87_001688 [Akanthomyces muscarius]KAJ4147143.1 hypothetical protein LMH87_001688 [Akanthomyces muscarius]